MSDVPSWQDIVAVLASVPKEDELKLLREYVGKVIESESDFTRLGKNTCKFFNMVVHKIGKILIMARLEHGGSLRLEYRPWLKEFFGIDDVSKLPFDVNDIAMQFKALFESEWRMESSEYAAEFELLHGKMAKTLVNELVEKLVKDMLTGPYFKEVFDRLVVTAN